MGDVGLGKAQKQQVDLSSQLANLCLLCCLCALQMDVPTVCLKNLFKCAHVSSGSFKLTHPRSTRRLWSWQLCDRALLPGY
jgi:hypothetical protein